MNEDMMLTMEEVAAGLAHEVKNPLSLVKANIDLLEQGDTQKEHIKNYCMMRREIERINDLLLDFVQFAKPSASNVKRTCLNALLTETMDSFQIAYKQRIAFSFESNGQDYFSLIDENQIRRVFVNLFKNAAEAMTEQKKPTIATAISLQKGNKNTGDMIQIQIKDNGRGISEEESQKLGTPFFSTKLTGSGLGLYMTKSIIAKHGGVFSIEGKPNEGCKVCVLLKNA